MPFELTSADIASAKAAAAKKFGSDALIGIDYRDPLSSELLVTVLFAALDLRATGEYEDARRASYAQARAGLFVDRRVYPSDERLAELRELWPAFDGSVEVELRQELGFATERAYARRLSAATAPPGLSAEDAAQLVTQEQPVRLWAVACAENGLACVLRTPVAAIYALGMTSFREAQAARRGTLCPMREIAEDHCAWAPGGSLRAHLEERPGRAASLVLPWMDIGGAGARTSARRF